MEVAEGRATAVGRRSHASKRLQGDAVVWLLVRGTDQELAARAKAALDAAIERLAEEIELPAGIGRPGSELLAKIPLHLKFSVVEVSVNSRDEQALIKLLHGGFKKTPLASDSYLAPVFGRGRVLDVLSASDIEAETISDLTQYLCGACSCQVKQQNPGFDLLCAMNWDEQLFDENFDPTSLASLNSANVTGESTIDSEPTLVTIPAGHKASDSTTSSAALNQPSSGGHIGLLFALAALAVAGSLIALAR